ncbi:hypothetical protein VPH35_084444 [Triticum aestivum]
MWTYIKALIIVAVLALFLLHVLGSLRRRSSNKALHAIVLGVYTLSYTLVSYTIGLMQRSDMYVREFSVWAVCLLMLLGGTDNLMAYGLNDVDNWKSFHVRHLIQGAFVVFIVAVYGTASRVQGPLWAILAVNALQSCVRIKSMKMASKSHLLSKSVKPIVDHMQMQREGRLHVASGQRTNPDTMEGYRYVVAGEHLWKNNAGQPSNQSKDGNVDGITTVDQVWQCKGSLLSSKTGLRLRDVCLSMALSKMLNRRFAGYELAEAELEETRDFVFRGLLAFGDEPCERAFRVIGVELGFVYDLYYTRYPYLYHKARYFGLCLPVAMVTLCSWLTYQLFNKFKGDVSSPDTTVFLMAVVTFLEAFQLYLHMASGWFKVALIRSYIAGQSWCLPRMIIGLLLRLKTLQPWEGKLGQYSLLQHYDGTRRASTCLYFMTLCLVDKAKKGRKRGKLVKLSRQVKKAIVDSLLESKGDLTNGTRSLQKAGVYGRLSWACSPGDGMVTHTILVWHVATTICKQLEPATLGNDDKQRSQVASDLSGYCAYLVAFAPDLLPDHSFDAESMLDKCIKEACKLDLPRGAKKMKSKCEELMKISGTKEDSGAETLVRMGGRLARELTEEIQEPALRWKVLADFWAEMMLYVAPCEDARARAHLEALARGGEFITHLWALLTHAGVLKRCPAAGQDAV